MADRVGQEEDYILGPVGVDWVDQGNSRYTRTVAVGAPGGVKVVGRAVVSGPATLRAANVKRRSIMVKAVTGPGTLYVGPSGTTNADGLEVLVGEAVVLDRSADAVGVDVSGGNVTLHWLEESNV